MAKVCFWFEENDTDVWSGRSIDLDCWNYAFKIAGDITDVIIVNESTIPDNEIIFNLEFNPQIVDTLPTLSGTVAQFVTPYENENSTSLWDFDHNVDWYVLGPARGFHDNYFGDKLIHIPQDGISYTHSIFINNLVMFHRYKTLH